MTRALGSGRGAPSGARAKGRLPLGALLGGLALALLALWLGQVGLYLYVSGQYERLQARAPKTRAELEADFVFTGHRRILQSEMTWGRNIQIEGAEFERYTVFGAPIDVVYVGDRVAYILSSFE